MAAEAQGQAFAAGAQIVCGWATFAWIFVPVIHMIMVDGSLRDASEWIHAACGCNEFASRF
jgi:hypothetical protein